MEQKGILVVSFGTSYPETGKKNIEHVETLLKDAFPDRRFYHAYTSGMIIRKLKKRDGVFIPTVAEALEQIIADGVTDLLVQPTHIMNGLEHDSMKADILARRAHFSVLAFGAPLLSSTEDQFTVIEALMKELPAPAPDEAILFMGHGSSHYANTLYASLDYCFKHRGFPNVHVGTVESYPDLPAVLESMDSQQTRHIYLAPFMLVAGDHALNDLAGDDEDSWKSILISKGYETTCILKGLGEYTGICSLYLDHARSAIQV